MSSNERLKVLELIREGKITPEEGLELLTVLQSADDGCDQAQGNESEEKNDFGNQSYKEDIAKILRIHFEKSNGKKGTITLPTSLVRFFGGLGNSNIRINDEQIDIDEWWEKQESGYKGVLYEATTDSGKDIKIELVDGKVGKKAKFFLDLDTE